MSDNIKDELAHRIWRVERAAQACADADSVEGSALLDEVTRLSASVSSAVEQCRAEQSVRDKEARYRAIVESAIDYAILTPGLDGTIQSWNAGANRMFGYEEEEVLGGTLNVILTYQDQQINRDAFERQMANELGHATNERWHICKDGKRVWGSGMMMPLRDPAGKLEGYVKIMHRSP